MKWFASILVLAVISSSSAEYLKVGKEYLYSVATTVAAGSDDYVHFASVFNISGNIRVQKVNPTLITVQLEDLKYGAYNGEFSYFPQPQYEVKAYQELNPLTEPFQIKLNAKNLVDGIVLSQNVPEWARNIQRGLAGNLQAELSSDKTNTNYEVNEKTVNGECPTTYQLTKDAAGQAEIRKYRSLTNCADRSISIRQPGRTAQYCPDDASRDVYNTTGWAVYRTGVKDGEPVIQSIMSGGGVVYSIFGAKGHTQYSFSTTTFVLQEVKGSGFKKISDPSNSKSYDSLKYVFEYEFDPEQDLTVPGPFFFHYKTAATDTATINDIVSKIKEYIHELTESLDSTDVFHDLVKFHQNSPFRLLPLVSALNYDQLKSIHQTLKAAATDDKKKIELNLFLDSLVLTGTGPAALLIRDVIASSSDDTRLVGRLISQVPHLMRNPTEKLLKEFEVLLKPDLSKHQGRFINFAYASLVGRVCKKQRCSKSDYLTKYIKIYSDQYDKADNFEDQTVAVLLLSNVGIEGALTKLRTIAVDATVDRTVRMAAIAGLKNLAKVDPDSFREAVLPIFYDASNHPELRNRALAIFFYNNFDEKNAQLMALSMWFEKCDQVKHYFYTFLKSLSTTTRPCLKSQGAHAASVLTFFPPMEIDRTKSGHYIRDYYDKDFNFGHMTQFSVQKSGESAFPTSVFIGFNGALGGYGTAYMSLFIRIEGVGKAIADRVMSMTTGQVDFDEVKAVFEKVGVKERSAEPLKIELALIVHGKVVAYHAADQKTVTTIPMWIKKLQEMKSAYEFNSARMMLMGGIIIEEPSTFGTPISTISSASGLIGLQAKVTRDKAGTGIQQQTDLKFQGHLFVYSTMNNHLPAFGTLHAVTAVRTYRARDPRHTTLGLDLKQQSLTFSAETPTEEDPFIVMVHATAFTQVKSDLGTPKDAAAVALLKASCPNCSPVAIISKGADARGTREIGIPKLTRFNYVSGLKRGAKFFDCERPHSRYHTVKKLAKYFSEDNKNTGGLVFWRIVLGLQHMRDALFLSPTTETCGVKGYAIQDKTAKTILQKIEGQVRVNYTPDPNQKLGAKVQIKSSINFKYGGSEPTTRTIDITGGVTTTGINDKRDIKLRFLAKDEKTQKNGVVCVEINAQNKKANDFLSYQGENEPTYERNIKVTWGPEPEGGKANACPTTAAFIKASRKAHRSQEQVEEGNGASWPFKECREQTNSKDWPGTVTPSTHECMQAAIDQTNLRESNISIDYKIDIESRNRWRKPAIALAAFLLPYWEEGSSSSAAHAHAHHVETKSDPDYAEGKLEIDVSASKTRPTLDIHFHGSQGQEEHFHNVDLQSLPGPLRPKPVFSRFSPYYYNLFQAGIFGYCVHSPQSVITFDNFTYNSELSDCPTLLAADCDDKPRFAVLSRKLGADKIGVTVMFGEHKIEVNDVNTAKVDGKDVPITDSVYTDEDAEKLFKFVKVNPNYVAIMSEKLSVFVGYTGNYATVTAGSRYRATSCGLCGNYNGNKNDDLVGPNPTCKLNASDMTKAYIVGEGKCKSSGC
jgi:hypothetical protein